METGWIYGKYLVVKSYITGDGSDITPYSLACFGYYPGAVWCLVGDRLLPERSSCLVYLDLERTPADVVERIQNERKGIVSILGEAERVPTTIGGSK